MHYGDGRIEVICGPMFCHRIGQRLLMADGTVRAVESLHKGDQLMGPDGATRNVTETHEGVGPMAEIRPARGGDPFVVTTAHELTLMDTPSDPAGKPSERGGRIVDVRVDEWLRWSASRKGIFKLWRTGVQDFVGGRLLPDDLDPYFLGLLLGDGSITQGVALSKPDVEVRMEAERQAALFGLAVKPDGEGTRVTWRIVGSRGAANPIATKLRDIGLYGHAGSSKFIPRRYMTARRDERRALLAGLVDSDGSSDGYGFDYVTASPELADGVVFVARSLGLSAHVKSCVKRCQTGASGTYYRTRICGDTSVVPTRIPRKQIVQREVKKRSDMTKFDVVTLPDPETYFGVTVDGDHRYLLDDYTVTHNSGKTEEIIRRLRRAVLGRQRVQAFKPAIDRRYHETRITSHSAQSIEAHAVNGAAEIEAAIEYDTQVVGIDEAQFFGPLLVPVATRLAERGVRVVIAGLDQDYRGEPFEPIPQLLAIAEGISKLTAVCVQCGGEATRSHRKAGGEATVEVGGADAYEARCRACTVRREAP